MKKGLLTNGPFVKFTKGQVTSIGQSERCLPWHTFIRIPSKSMQKSKRRTQNEPRSAGRALERGQISGRRTYPPGVIRPAFGSGETGRAHPTRTTHLVGACISRLAVRIMGRKAGRIMHREADGLNAADAGSDGLPDGPSPRSLLFAVCGPSRNRSPDGFPTSGQMWDSEVHRSARPLWDSGTHRSIRSPWDSGTYRSARLLWNGGARRSARPLWGRGPHRSVRLLAQGARRAFAAPAMAGNKGLCA